MCPFHSALVIASFCHVHVTSLTLLLIRLCFPLLNHSACDGLWDVIKNQEAVNFIKKEMLNPQTTLDEVCEKLVTLALKKGSTDNISLVIVAITVE